MEFDYGGEPEGNFDCASCPSQTQALRRCHEDRFDFTPEDNGSIFPMYIAKGGALYGFCPAKARWDFDALQLYRLLVISAGTGALPYNGGISSQPAWFVELLSWFLPLYERIRWNAKVRPIAAAFGKAP